LADEFCYIVNNQLHATLNNGKSGEKSNQYRLKMKI